jgi:hypothetical protein
MLGPQEKPPLGPREHGLHDVVHVRDGLLDGPAAAAGPLAQPDPVPVVGENVKPCVHQGIMDGPGRRHRRGQTVGDADRVPATRPGAPPAGETSRKEVRPRAHWHHHHVVKGDTGENARVAAAEEKVSQKSNRHAKPKQGDHSVTVSECQKLFLLATFLVSMQATTPRRPTKDEGMQSPP